MSIRVQMAAIEGRHPHLSQCDQMQNCKGGFDNYLLAKPNTKHLNTTYRRRMLRFWNIMAPHAVVILCPSVVWYRASFWAFMLRVNWLVGWVSVASIASVRKPCTLDDIHSGQVKRIKPYLSYIQDNYIRYLIQAQAGNISYYIPFKLSINNIIILNINISYNNIILNL